jgi:hypothetical protein
MCFFFATKGVATKGTLTGRISHVFYFLKTSFFTTKGAVSKETLTGRISKLYKIQGTSIINAITIGNRTVQQ